MTLKYRPIRTTERATTVKRADVASAMKEVILARKRGGRGRIRAAVPKRGYQEIDFKRDMRNVPAQVVAIEHDPRLAADVARLRYADGEIRYILAPRGLAVGATVVAGENVEVAIGNALPLADIPPDTTIHNIEVRETTSCRSRSG